MWLVSATVAHTWAAVGLVYQLDVMVTEGGSGTDDRLERGVQSPDGILTICSEELERNSWRILNELLKILEEFFSRIIQEPLRILKNFLKGISIHWSGE